MQAIHRKYVAFPHLENSEFQRLILKASRVAFEPHPNAPTLGSNKIPAVRWDTFMSPVADGPRSASDQRREVTRDTLQSIYTAFDVRHEAIIKAFTDRRLTNEGAADRALSEVTGLLQGVTFLPPNVYHGVPDSQRYAGRLLKVLDSTEAAAKQLADRLASLSTPTVEKTVAGEWRALVREVQGDTHTKIEALRNLISENGEEVTASILSSGPALSGLTPEMHRALLWMARITGNMEEFTDIRIEAECLDSLRLAMYRAASQAVTDARIRPEKQLEMLKPFTDTPEFLRLLTLIDETEAAVKMYEGDVHVSPDPDKKPVEDESVERQAAVAFGVSV